VISGEVPDRHNWLTFVYPGQPLETVGSSAGSKSAR
jgi:hypothetical protein